MKRSKNIAVRNIAGKPLRSAVLVILAALLSLTVCAGTLIVRSLRSGLDSLEARLGADVMVVPKEASQKQSFENIVLQGSTGYFYMDKSLMDKVTGRDGVGKSSPQFFLASASAGCCSIPVQIIGFDPDTDFTITPWIKRSYGGELGLFDVVIGNDLNAFVGDSIKFYGVDCRVAAKLDKTGTNFDTAVFTNADTIKQLIRASLDLGMNSFESLDPDNSVSCVLINSDGTRSPEEIVNDINVHVKKVRAFRTGFGRYRRDDSGGVALRSCDTSSCLYHERERAQKGVRRASCGRRITGKTRLCSYAGGRHYRPCGKHCRRFARYSGDSAVQQSHRKCTGTAFSYSGYRLCGSACGDVSAAFCGSVRTCGGSFSGKDKQDRYGTHTSGG